jgi:hypothetical protein
LTLKQQLAPKIGTDVKNIQLICNTKKLDNTKPLRDYGIHAKSKLEFIVFVSGG